MLKYNKVNFITSVKVLSHTKGKVLLHTQFIKIKIRASS
jgi:hypothetical protein